MSCDLDHLYKLSFPLPKNAPHKIGQGQPRVIIYINFVELESPMLHAMFQDHRTSGSGEEDFLKVFTIYGHDGHLGHVTWTIYINFHSPFPRRLDYFTLCKIIHAFYNL